MSIGRNFFNHPSLPQPNHRADADCMDSTDTSLPSGLPNALTIDGVLITNGMRVLFTNLASGNNQVYKAVFELDAPAPVQWVAQVDAGHGGPAPLSCDMIHIASGTANGGRLLVYDSTWQDADMMVEGKLQVNDSAAASTPGSVVKKMPVYDENGNLLGYLPIYSSIS